MTATKIWGDLIDQSNKDVLAKIKLYLRIAIAACFIGHGMWGLVFKPGWLPFFHLFGIPDNIAWPLIFLVGLKDIICGIWIIYSDSKYLLYWIIFWAIFVALLRPFLGMGMEGFIERAGNYGPPIAMLYFLTYIWKKELSQQLLNQRIGKLEWILRISLFLLLLGHGGVANMLTQNADYKVLIQNLETFGLPTTYAFMTTLAVFEVCLSFIVLFWPRIQGLMWFVLIFKILSESMYPFTFGAYSIFETIERFGDYMIPLLLMVIYRNWTKEELA